MSRPLPILITGGAGFIGANLAHRLLGQGRDILIFDNLSRAGVERNLEWLQHTHGPAARFQLGDVRDRAALQKAVAQCSRIFHLAAQVAVTTSFIDPRADFDTNVLGTLNLLEAVRQMDTPPPLVYTSTNKVYGSLDGVPLQLTSSRYEPAEAVVRASGIDEACPLSFCTPYGCSKGAADQYVLDYARSFGIPACVFRMSCIYGPHQFGTEDQGWVAHFLIRALEGQPLTIYGDGFQIRDILYVDDLVDALTAASENIGRLSGEAFNMGGGPERTVSLRELLKMFQEFDCGCPEIHYEPTRPGDQRYYVSNTAKFRAATGWAPRIGPREGARNLYNWLAQSRQAECQPLVMTR